MSFMAIMTSVVVLSVAAAISMLSGVWGLAFIFGFVAIMLFLLQIIEELLKIQIMLSEQDEIEEK